MSRFKVAYNLGKGLTETEVDKKIDDLNNQEIHIVDTTGELPNLTITDIDEGRKYVQYMNKTVNEQKIITLITEIRKDIDEMNNISSQLIKPQKKIKTYNEYDEPVMEMDLTDELFYKGYTTIMGEWTVKINNKLNQLKRLLTED